jgi:nucleoside-diphosphate-sugar epimerase
MDLVWGRVFWHYGPGDNPNKLIPSVIRALLGNQKFTCFHGSFLRDYLYIDDAASALVAVMESDFNGAINIASGDGIKLKDLVQGVAKLTGNSGLLEIRNDPGSLEDSPAIVADTQKLNNIVGWTPNISLEQGLQLTVDWWKEKLGNTGAGHYLSDSPVKKRESVNNL